MSEKSKGENMALEVRQLGTLIDGVAANAAAALRTTEISVKHSSSLLISYALSQSAASAMTVQVFKSPDSGVTYSRVPSVAIDDGTGTASDYTVSKAVTGDDTLAVDIDCANCTHIKIIVAATGGGASDLITVKASAGVWS